MLKISYTGCLGPAAISAQFTLECALQQKVEQNIRTHYYYY